MRSPNDNWNLTITTTDNELRWLLDVLHEADPSHLDDLTSQLSAALAERGGSCFRDYTVVTQNPDVAAIASSKLTVSESAQDMPDAMVDNIISSSRMMIPGA